MEEKLFNELKKTNWFDCNEDIYDLISDVIDSLKEEKIDKAIDEAMGWIDCVYDNLHKDIEFDIPKTKRFFKNLFESVLNDNRLASKKEIIELLENCDVDKAEVMSNILTEYEAEDIISDRMVERGWTLKEVKEFFGYI